MTYKAVLIVVNELTREGLAKIMGEQDFEVVHSSNSPRNCPDDALTGSCLALIDGGSHERSLKLMDEMRAKNPDIHCLIFGDSFNYDEMMECFRHLAHGYLLKNANCAQLIASLKLAAVGERVMPSDLIDVLVRVNGKASTFIDFEVDPEEAQLSRRELDVLCCLAAGDSNKLIARRLDVSEATVKVHVKAIMRKLNVSNRTQAAMWGTMHLVASQPKYDGRARA